MKAQLAALTISLVLAHPATAEDRVDVLVGNGPGVLLQTLELDAGGVIGVDAIDLQAITPFALPNLQCVERVRGEVWIGSTLGLLRYGGSPLAFIGQSQASDRIQAVTEAPFGAILAGVRTAIEVDASGAEIRRVDTSPTTFSDIDAFQGGYLGVGNDRVLQLDLDYNVLGEFAPTAFAIAQQSGTGYFPERITILADGRVVVAAIVSIGIIEANGTVQAIANPGPFERDVFETGGGLLLVPTVAGLYLMDGDTLEVFERTPTLPGFNGSRYGSRYSTTERGSSGRACTATSNSTGAEARLHLLASPRLTDTKLSSIATDLPANTFGLPIFGQAATNVPFGDGRLCVSPFAPGIVRGPVSRALGSGSLRTDFDFVTPGLGLSFAAGTTWHYQVLFRDSGPAGFDGTDAVFVTFEP